MFLLEMLDFCALKIKNARCSKETRRFMELYGTPPSQTHAPSSTYTHTLHRGFWLRVGDRASAGFSLGNSAAILQPQSFMPLVAILYQHFSHGCVRNVERVIMLSGSSGHLTNEILISPACLALGRSQDTNIFLKYCTQSNLAVSYTHLTLPTKLEV